MRVIFVAVVTAIAVVGCEKDPAATESTKQLTPAADSRAKALPANAPKTIDVEGTVVRQGKAGDNDAVDDEGLGEPMDDVDDAESASDKSGVDKAGAPNPPGDDAPKGDQVDEDE